MLESGSPLLWPPSLSMNWSRGMTVTQTTWTRSTGTSSPQPTLMDILTLLKLTECGGRPGVLSLVMEDIALELIQTETGTSIGEVDFVNLGLRKLK